MRSCDGYTYRYEMHVHDCFCSACGVSTPIEMTKAYYDAGYTGMIYTNHFLTGNTAVDKSLPWKEKIAVYENAFLQSRTWAQQQEREFHVLFGLEHMYGDAREVLVYGISPQFLYEHPNFHLYPLPKFYEAVHQAGGVLSMAHPYRQRDYIPEGIPIRPKYLDGMEIFNFFNTGEENKKATVYAEKHGLFPTSGSDEHDCSRGGVGMAGIALKTPVDTSAELAEVLKSGDYRVIINGEVY